MLLKFYMHQTKENKQQLQIRTLPTVTMRLNKPLILVLVGIIIFLISWAIINAFVPNTKPKKNIPKVAESFELISAPIISDAIKDLPGSYQEIQKIKQYQTPAVNNVTIPPAVQEELNYLKQQQVELQERLALLTVKSNHDADAHVKSEVGPANNSAMFFPTTNPESVTNETNKETISAEKLEADKSEDIYDSHRITKPISPYIIQAGTLLPAVLLTGINTSLPGNIVAQVSHDVFDTITGKYLLIPKGAKLLGSYESQISQGQRRILIFFTRMIYPDGASILLPKTNAADLRGEAGVEGNVDNHWLGILGAATLSTMLSIGAGIAADNNQVPNVYYPGAKHGALLGAATGIIQTGQGIVNRSLGMQPTLTIPPGLHFNIIVQKDLVLTL